jgi:hypothetical protein
MAVKVDTAVSVSAHNLAASSGRTYYIDSTVTSWSGTPTTDHPTTATALGSMTAYADIDLAFNICSSSGSGESSCHGKDCSGGVCTASAAAAAGDVYFYKL